MLKLLSKLDRGTSIKLIEELELNLMQSAAGANSGSVHLKPP